MNKQYLKKILSIQSTTYKQFRTFSFVVRELHRLNIPFFVDNGNIYATKGIAGIFPCVVAHLDTVHDIIKDFQVHEVNSCFYAVNGQTLQQTGIGGDDKVGIYIALTMLQKFDSIKVAFFIDEEHGCLGSYDANLAFFLDCNFVLQFDRKGYGDFVTNISGITLSSKHFQNQIKPVLKTYNYSFCSGGMTDILALAEMGIGCSVANISCGYYRPHANNEYVKIKEVERIEAMAIEIIKRLGDGNYQHSVSKKAYRYRPSEMLDLSWDSLWDGLSKDKKTVKKDSGYCECEGCGTACSNTSYVSAANMDLCSTCKSYFDY